MTDHLQAIITVLSLVNPFMCAAIFAQIEAGKSHGAQLGSATKAALAVLIILTVAALVGVKVLHLFGVSLDAFMVERRRARTAMSPARAVTSLARSRARCLAPG